VGPLELGLCQPTVHRCAGEVIALVFLSGIALGAGSSQTTRTNARIRLFAGRHA